MTRIDKNRTISGAINAVLIVFLSFLSLASYGQNQLVRVKTKGRIIDGKHVHGDGLEGAAVRIQNGNVYIARNKYGLLSFPIPSSNTFVIKSVFLKDYQLVDADVVGRSYHYSEDTLYILMETPKQQAQDLLDAERKMHRILQEKYQKKKNKLETLKKKHKITQEEYQETLKRLDAQLKNLRNLIPSTAKTYAQLDYDQMGDELKIRILDALTNGRLSEVDSLMRSKGDIKTRIKESKSVDDEIVEDCEILCNRFMMELEVDSAVYYVEQIVNLNPTNIRYLGKVGNFYQKICSYDKAVEYYNRALYICSLFVEDNAFDMCRLQANLAGVYTFCKNYSKAEEFIKSNIEIVNRFGGKIYSKYNGTDYIDEFHCLLSLESLYISMHHYDDAESLCLKLIELLQNDHFKYEEVEKQTSISYLYFSLGTIYYSDNKYEKGDSALMESVEITRKLALDDSSCYNNLGMYLTTWAILKLTQEHYEESEILCKEALESFNNYERYSNERKEFETAQIWALLGSICLNTQRPSDSEKWYEDALNVYRRYAKAIPEKYNSSLSVAIKGLARLYKDMGRLDESESYYMEVLEIDSLLAINDPQEYMSEIVFIENELGIIKCLREQYFEADSLFNNALLISKKYAGDGHESDDSQIIETLTNLAHLYSIIMVKSFYNNRDYIVFRQLKDLQKQYLPIVRDQYQQQPDIFKNLYVATLGKQSFECIYDGRLEEAERFATEALDVDPSQKWIFSSLAAAQLFQGKYEEAENIFFYLKREMKDQFLKDLDEFEAANVIPPQRMKDVREIEKMLNN